ncbi:peptidase M48 [Litorivita pollutaquae]|uniref:Peptidase M48 n=1 Tax=Litorivita pollutaquae TaxID=2200892 RepID=A0A2V4NU32_9RHOB|nr:M48 family metalloprotease [Litorivita pollutaquae]OUS21997.1 peptidase M48 [Rhodobacterales bacterium 59_46_T64]PYC48466.1 peptidase M48 [Litorivita pollutaquae]
MRLLRSFYAAVTVASLAMLMLASPARAASLIRDPDIEYALGQLAAPLLKAAGLSPNRVKVLVINDSNLNAYVIDSDHIFIHSGLILRMERAAQLQSVIAHEAAHIAGGHLTRRRNNMANMRSVAGIGIALAAATAAASGNVQAASGVGLGISSSAARSFMAHTRDEESAADNAGLRYMVRAGVDPKGALEVQSMFKGQETLSAARQDPYARTHPLSRDRYRRLEAATAGLKGKVPDGDSDAARYWFDRAKGKLSAFQRAPKWTMRRAKESVSADITLMRQAIAYHRQSKTSAALAALDRAIVMRPKDPYFMELKGQILIERRQFRAAVGAYESAARMAPNNPLILAGLGRSLLALDTADATRKALTVLEKSRARDYTNGNAMRDLGMAYARLGNHGMASLAVAERHALRGRMKDAALHANRAAGLLPQGSGAWQRAQDVIFAAKAASKRR